eukprot:symbB.v1.2.014392.t1/scaffold1052.1/size141681/9
MPDKAAEAERLGRLGRELRPQAAVGPVPATELPVDCVRFTGQQIVDAIRMENVIGGPHRASKPEDVLLYTYTGGTTKHSKCVVVTHAMALWEMQNYHVVLGNNMSSADRVLQFTSAYWGAAAFGQIDIALAFGACVVFSNSKTEDLASVIEDYQITVLGTVPSLLRATYPGGPGSKAGSLRLILTWGESLPVKLSKAWKEVCLMVDLLIASEYWLALYSYCDVYRDPVDGREKHLLIPLPKLQMHLLSENGQTLSVKGEGEMILRGDTVSPGYIGADGRICNDESCDFFLDGLRYLRTRDKLRWVKDGTCLVYCGRTGSLAKRGGQFVDLEDLAEKLQNIPGMASCALLAGEKLDAFCTLDADEALQLPGPVTSILSDAQKLLGPSARLHLRSRLPRHPITGKVERGKLEEQISALLQREVQETQRRMQIQRKMLRSYYWWYPVVLLQVILFSFLGPALWRWAADANSRFDAWNVMSSLPWRLVLLPYLWASLAYTPLLPLQLKRRDRAFYESAGISPPELLLLLVGLIPSFLICTVQVLACALLTFYRREQVSSALAFLAAALVLPVLPFATQLAVCIGCVAVDVLLPHDDRYVLPSIPICYYLVLPKWFSDEVSWYLEHSGWRTLLHFWRPQKIPWDATWPWEDNDRSFSILNDECGSVRVGKANHGLSLTVDFSQEIQVSNCASGPSNPVEESNGSIETPLTGLVRRAGGDGKALRLDSLQSTVLAELIRKELRRSVSVADVLRSRDISELQEKLDASESELRDEESLSEPTRSGTYRVFMLQFPRHPVDWCLRYTGGHIDLPAMQRAVDRLVERPSLGTLATTLCENKPR